MPSVLLLLATSLASPPDVEVERPYLQEALEVAKWLRSVEVRTEAGKTWPAAPRDSGASGPYLYSGYAGVVLFFLELGRATGDAQWTEDAKLGADAIIASLPANTSQVDSGLYTGIAGLGFVLEEVFQTTQDPKYRRASRRCVGLISEAAKKVGAGVEWNEVTDIIRGSAGTGLFLLYARERMNDDELLELAAKAGHRLVELGKKEHGGLSWSMSRSYTPSMPNFSHGTAGICYFLATLYQETGEPVFLDAALEGVKYLDAIAKKDEGYLVFHHAPEGEDLFYLGWCHGPTGTGRLFHRLWAITKEQTHRDRLMAGAKSVSESGIPDKLTPGFWNNVSQCCGTAGVAAYFVELHKVSGDEAHLAFAEKMTQNLLSRSTRAEHGQYWVQAEHRVRPELLQAQTGYMQGAAGIGLLLLQWDAFERDRDFPLRFPDSPF